jgi:hypothetical protein
MKMKMKPISFGGVRTTPTTHIDFFTLQTTHPHRNTQEQPKNGRNPNQPHTHEQHPTHEREKRERRRQREEKERERERLCVVVRGGTWGRGGGGEGGCGEGVCEGGKGNYQLNIGFH